MPAAIAGSCLAVTCLFFGAIALLLLGVAEKREGRWKLLCSYGDNIWDLCWMLREDGIYMVFSDLWNLFVFLVGRTCLFWDVYSVYIYTCINEFHVTYACIHTYI